MPHDKDNWPLAVNDVVILRCRIIRCELGEDYGNVVIETAEDMFPSNAPINFAVNSRQLERLPDAVTAQMVADRLEALTTQTGQQKLDTLIQLGEALVMSLATLQTKVDALVAAQAANSTAVIAEISRISTAVDAVRSLPVDTTAIEAQLQTVITNLTASQAALDAAAPAPPTP